PAPQGVARRVDTAASAEPKSAAAEPPAGHAPPAARETTPPGGGAAAKRRLAPRRPPPHPPPPNRRRGLLIGVTAARRRWRSYDSLRVPKSECRTTAAGRVSPCRSENTTFRVHPRSISTTVCEASRATRHAFTGARSRDRKSTR